MLPVGVGASVAVGCGASFLLDAFAIRWAGGVYDSERRDIDRFTLTSPPQCDLFFFYFLKKKITVCCVHRVEHVCQAETAIGHLAAWTFRAHTSASSVGLVQPYTSRVRV